MSDSYKSIVPINVKKDEVESIASKVLDWLTAKKIIKNEITDCTLGENGYPPSENYKSIIEGHDYDFTTLWTNGLAIIKNREVFENGGNGLEEINCPTCGTNIIEQDWQQAIEEWYNETGKDSMKCPHCNSQESITQYHFVPMWAFGELGFKFWNWPDFKPSFIEEFEKVVEKPIVIVYGII
jgi:DNA-directed RNA polymerase subunit RPC12/RpoP